MRFVPTKTMSVRKQRAILRQMNVLALIKELQPVTYVDIIDAARNRYGYRDVHDDLVELFIGDVISYCETCGRIFLVNGMDKCHYCKRIEAIWAEAGVAT